MNPITLLLVLLARWKIVVLTVVTAAGTTYLVSKLLPKTYESTAHVLIDLKGQDQVTGALVPIQLVPGYMTTQREIMTSHGVGLKVVRTLHLADSPEARKQFLETAKGKGSIEDWLADVLLKKLDVKPSRDSSIVEVTYSANEPRFAKELANAFAQAYIDTALELKVNPSRDSATWFEQQSASARNALEEAQARLSAFQRKNGIVANDERIDVETARLNELSTQLVQAQASSYDSGTRARTGAELQRGGAAVVDALPELIGNSVIQGLKMQVSQKESELAQASQNIGINHPEYRRVQKELESLRLQIASETAKVVRSMGNVHEVNLRREAEIRNALATQKEKLLTIKRQRDDMAVLQRDVETNQRTYELVRQRLTQTSLEGRQNQTNVVMLTLATEPINAAHPKVFLNTFLATILGGLLGVAAALLLEMIDTRVRGQNQLADIVGAPLLGQLGRARRASRLRGLLPRLGRFARPARA
jgi:succinoglycan biosynthesis transport protein ExoP